jgi:transposase-like protein
MNTVPRKRYTTEFKAQAVELLSTGKPVSEVAEELCISSNLLYGWRHSSQEREPQASAPKRTSCAPCGAKTPSCARRTTF